MRLFMNTTEAYPEILRDLIKFGRTVKSNTVQNWKNVSDDYIMKEIQCYSFCVLDSSDMWDTCKDPEWIQAEFMERLMNVNPGECWKMRAEYWETVMKDGKHDYTYGERMHDVVPRVIELLKDNPETRQAIISLWNHEDHFVTNGNKRVPCTMYYNIQIREGAVDVIYHMRSSDYAEHFKNDFTLACELRNYIAYKLGLPVGKAFMTVDSLHAYKKDWASLNIF